MYMGKAAYFSKVPPIILAKLQKKDFFSRGGKKIQPSINQICYKEGCITVPLDYIYNVFKSTDLLNMSGPPDEK